MNPPVARNSTPRIREAARAAGFDAVGVAAAASLAGTLEERRLLAWLTEGRQGTMAYLARDPSRRLDPARVLPGVASVVSVAMSYWVPAGETEAGAGRPGRGRVARYARGRDYHKVFETRLKRLEAEIRNLLPGIGTRRYVDTGPVMEKLWAERAGLGWRGKHTNLVSRSLGSWFLLGEILVAAPLEADAPAVDRCGTCTRCLEACPTRAITAPHRLDARRCISYLTIEHRGAIPEVLRPMMGDRVFGCDDCLEVCPWNRFARESREADFHPRPEVLAPLLSELATMDEEGFYRRFSGSPLVRAKRAGLARNACVALGNTGGPGAEAALERAADDASPLVREHAGWALARRRNDDGS